MSDNQGESRAFLIEMLPFLAKEKNFGKFSFGTLSFQMSCQKKYAADVAFVSSGLIGKQLIRDRVKCARGSPTRKVLTQIRSKHEMLECKDRNDCHL